MVTVRLCSLLFFEYFILGFSSIDVESAGLYHRSKTSGEVTMHFIVKSWFRGTFIDLSETLSLTSQAEKKGQNDDIAKSAFKSDIFLHITI